MDTKRTCNTAFDEIIVVGRKDSMLCRQMAHKIY